jgi:hypothetical protein
MKKRTHPHNLGKAHIGREKKKKKRNSGSTADTQSEGPASVTKKEESTADTQSEGPASVTKKEESTDTTE